MRIPEDVFEHILSKATLPCLYPRQATIAHEGEPCVKAGIVTRGRIKLIHLSRSGEETHLGTLEEGELFGDVIVHGPTATYPASLIAECDSAVVYLEASSLDDLMVESSGFRAWYLAHVAEKFSVLNRRLKILSRPTIKERLLYWLETVADEKGAVRIDSVSALAEQLNVARVSLSRSLHAMKRAGVIAYENRVFRLRR